MAEIRGAILEAAARCYRDDVHAGQPERAERQLAIVKAICSHVPAKQSMTQLALSNRQYYRDRIAICRRVAKLLTVAQRAEFSRLDVGEPLDFLLQRAGALIEQGFSDMAARELERALAQTGTPQVKIAALLELSKAAVASGSVERAGEALSTANALLARLGEAAGAARLRERARFISVRVARAAGKYGEACSVLDSVVGLETLHEDVMREPTEELLGYELESSSICCERSLYDAARRHYDAALGISSRLGTVAPEHRARLAYMASYQRFAAGTMDEQLLSAREALDECLLLGSAHGTLYSSLRLATNFAGIGDEERAFQYCDRALTVARAIDGKEATVEACLHVASALISTRFWRTLDPMLFTVEGFSRKGTLEWTGLKSFQGKLLRRSGRKQEAVDALFMAEAAIGRFRTKAKHALILFDLALALHDVGRPSEAADRLRAAIALGEDLGEGATLYRLYRAAFVLLGDRRLGALAERMRPARPTKRHVDARALGGAALRA